MLKFGKLPQVQQYMKDNWKSFYPWLDLTNDLRQIAHSISGKEKQFKNIYGIPRGGLILAVMLSHSLNLPVILDKNEITEETIVIDDISDSGETFTRIPKSGLFVTLFIDKDTKSMPDIYKHTKKKDEWIVFPWETLSSSKYDQNI